MPNGTGFDLLTHFPDKDFDVVFITAFNHYAIKAIKFSAVDYILKPININEFIESVNRVVQKRVNNTKTGNENFEALLENIKQYTSDKTCNTNILMEGNILILKILSG